MQDAEDATIQLLAARADAAELRGIFETSGRLALLSHLKDAGVSPVSRRQRLANAVCRAIRAAVLPVVFIHIGIRPYVETAVRLTAAHQTPVIVIGDSSMRCLGQISGVEFVDIQPYRADEAIAQARLHYVNHSSNPAEFEFFCFERIFILRRFLTSRGINRVFHLDSDCVLLKPLSAFPLHLHRVWLVNNDFYHTHGFSLLPSASVHASVLDMGFCRQFESLYRQIFVERALSSLPPAVGELLTWAEEHSRRGGAGGLSDMSLYFLLQARTDAWASKTLGLVDDVGDLGKHWTVGGHSEATHPAGLDATPPLTFMNNINTGEGPMGINQYAVDRAVGMMRVQRCAEDGALLIRDLLGNRDVAICCAHFSGSAKRLLTAEWLVQHFGCDPKVFGDQRVTASKV